MVCDAAHAQDFWQVPWPVLPDVVVSALRLGAEATLPLLHELRTRCPSIRIVLLIDAHQQDELSSFTTLPLVSCLCWDDLDLEGLRHCLTTVLAGPLAVYSASIHDAGGTRPPPSRAGAAQALHHCDARAPAVLAGLAAGCTEQQVARGMGVSRRSVQRTIAELQAVLGVSSLFALGCTAARLGLLTDGSLDHRAEPR
jgi:DNA-binding NarL/FixJ family response regulator